MDHFSVIGHLGYFVFSSIIDDFDHYWIPWLVLQPPPQSEAFDFFISQSRYKVSGKDYSNMISTLGLSKKGARSHRNTM